MSIGIELLSTPVKGLAFEVFITNDTDTDYVVYLAPGPYVTVNRISVGVEKGDRTKIYVTINADSGYIDLSWAGGESRVEFETIPEEQYEFGRVSPYTIIELPELPEPVYIDTTMRVGKVFLAPGVRIIYRRDIYNS